MQAVLCFQALKFMQIIAMLISITVRAPTSSGSQYKGKAQNKWPRILGWCPNPHLARSFGTHPFAVMHFHFFRPNR